MVKVSEEARKWVELIRKDADSDKKWQLAEARYALDRVFTRFREEMLVVPWLLSNFQEAQRALKALREKYCLCIQLREKHEDLKKDDYFDVKTEYGPTLKKLIDDHNDGASHFPVDALPDPKSNDLEVKL